MIFVVLALEILFYTLFFKLSKRKGSIAIYTIVFTLSTVALYFLYDYRLIGYLLFVLISVIGLRYLTPSNNGAFDILLLLIAMLFKLILEPICFVPYIFYKDIYMCTIIASLIKILVIILLRGLLNKMYRKLLNDWNNNRFYIRYIASIGLMLYIIATCILLVVNLI